MNEFDPLHLIGTMRHRELLHIAERERSVRAAFKDHSNRWSGRLWSIVKIRSWLLENSTSGHNPYRRKCKSISSVS